MRRAGPVDEAIPLAKLRPPELQPGHVARHAVAARLAEAWHHPVTLVSAPAGYGKSSAVVSALHVVGGRRRSGAAAAPGPHGRLAWVSLDEHDAEPERFFRLVGTALQRATGLGAELVSALAAPQPPPVRPLLTTLLNALTEADAQVLLCIDDLHVVDDARVHEDLAFLVEHAPPGLRLLLASRADPPLPLHRWRARGQLLEVRADDLRLRMEETSAVLAAALGRPLDETTAIAVHRATEGWAVGARLASLVLRGAAERDERALVARLGADEGFALEYLAEEVLARLPAPLTAFLLDTAALDVFSPDLLDAVRGTTEARAHLDQARAAGLFLEAAAAPPGVGSERSWWRYHRLFRSLLRGHARAADPEREQALQRRAADWFDAQGATATAVTLALSAGDAERAARFLDTSAYALVMDGHARLVERALESMSEDIRSRAPHARLAHGWALLLRGRYDDLAAVLTDLTGATDAFQDADRAQLAALSAVLADTRGHAEAALTLAREALAAAPEGDVITRASAQMALAGAHREQGDLGAATAAYEAALPLCRAARLAVPEGLARAHLGRLYLQRGRLGKALSVTQPLAGGEAHPAAAAALASRCSALLEQDRRDEVRRVLPGVTALAVRADQPAVVANVHLVWSRLHRADGDDQRAREALEAAQAAAARGVPTWLRTLISIRAAEASLTDGDADAAEAHLHAAEAFAPRGPVASELALLRARFRLHRGTQIDLASAHDIAHSLYDGDAAPGDGMRIAALVVGALALAAAGSVRDAQATLARAIRSAEPEGYVRTFVEAGPSCAALLASVGHPYATRVLDAFAPDLRDRAHPAATPGDASRLTERERDILAALASARTYERIAQEHGVSVNTVRFHVKNVYAKLGVRTRLEAVERARRLGYVNEAPGAGADGSGTVSR